jgi:peptide methionine sulfoxide reductase msrA/msrB
LLAVVGRAADKEAAMAFNQLTKEEEQVLIHKGTEPAFSGKFVNHHEPGTYTCKRCNAPLFSSDSKFESGTGWPSFDDCLPGAVKRIPDADGLRTEIVCARCGAHLGHVFVGEGFTNKLTRNCVNSVCLDFKPAVKPAPAVQANPAANSSPVLIQTQERAIFAGGCFWGVEHYFKREPGVLSTTVGYIGGQTANPAYQQVCAHGTGHAEAIEVVFDPRVTSFEKLAKLFFEIHDPTQLNRQGPDIGDQYRSAVFYVNDEQKAIAEKLIRELKSKGYNVVTQVVKAGPFWKGEEYHQDYYQKTGKQPYCHTRTKRF